MEATNIMIYVTNNCNLNCPYCFVNKDPRRMNLETAKATVDFLIGQAKKTKNLGINFFGGEPLLEFELIKKIVDYCEEQGKKHNKNISFGATTNGTLFTQEIIDYFWENDFGILFSFDGDKEHIIKVKGEKAYEQMINSIRLLRKKGFRLHARVTACPDDLRLVDFVKYIFGVGFEGASICPMSGTQAWNQGETDKAYMELADYFIEQAKQDNMIEEKYFKKDLLVSLELQKPSQVPCGAGKGLLGISVDGKILPCQHPETWEKNHTLGNVFEKKIDEDIRRPFLEYKRDDFIGCKDCIARPHCIGSCPNVSYDINGNMLKPWKGGCVWTMARFKAVEHIFNELYVKQKNPYFIKWLLKDQVGWAPYKREHVFDGSKLDEYEELEHVKSVLFKISKHDLNLETGNKIIQFIEKLKKTNNNSFKIAKPLPPCLFGFKSQQVFKEYKIPMQKGGRLDKLKTPDYVLRTCDAGKGFTLQMKKLRELYRYHIKNIEIPKKCEDCIYRMRKKCDYPYFGF